MTVLCFGDIFTAGPLSKVCTLQTLHDPIVMFVQLFLILMPKCNHKTVIIMWQSTTEAMPSTPIFYDRIILIYLGGGPTVNATFCFSQLTTSHFLKKYLSRKPFVTTFIQNCQNQPFCTVKVMVVTAKIRKSILKIHLWPQRMLLYFRYLCVYVFP